MQTFNHFLLTRFNVASPGREEAIRNAPGWLRRRFELFEKYCLPSVASQSMRSFKWLIYFDAATPDEFRSRIENAQAIAQFEAIFVKHFHARLAASDVAARLTEPKGRLITTRLDNDDAISRDYLEQIQEVCRKSPDGRIINFRDGIALKNGNLFEATDTSNPFASLIEPAQDAKTIWAAPHTELAKRFELQQVINEPCWLQVVHGENVANRIKGKRIARGSFINRFTLERSVEIAETSPLLIAYDRAVAYPARWLREAAIRTAKALLRRH